MNGSELHQIATAVAIAIRHRTPDGNMVSAEAVYAILNSHCPDGQVSLESSENGMEYRFKAAVKA